MDIYGAARKIFYGYDVGMQLVEDVVPIVFTSSLEPFIEDGQGRKVNKPVNKADIQEIVTTMVQVLSPRCISSKLWYVRYSDEFRHDGEI